MAEKIFCVFLRFLDSGGITTVFKSQLLQSNLDGVFRLKAPGNQFSGACGEAFGIGRDGGLAMRRASVLFKLRRCETIIGALRVLIGQQGWDWKSPATVRARPAGQPLMRYPSKPSGRVSP